MKWFHNSAIGKFIVIAFAVAIHGLFAAGAYYLGLFLGGIIFADMPLMQQIFASGYAVLVFVGAIWAFIYSEYAYEDITAYGNMTGHTRYTGYLHAVMVGVMGSELASVFFRAWNTSSLAGGLVTLAIGGFTLGIAFSLGKVIHAMVNRPFAASILRAREEAGRSIVDNASSYVPKMTVEQKRRFYTGDLSTVDEVMQDELDRKGEKVQARETKAEEKARRKETKELSKQQKAQRQQQSQQIGAAYTGKLLGDEPVTSYPHFQPAQSNLSGNHLSQSNNGNHANRNN